MSSCYSLEIDGHEINSGPKYIHCIEADLFTPQDRKVKSEDAACRFTYEIPVGVLSKRLNSIGFPWINAKIALQELIDSVINIINSQNLDYMTGEWQENEREFKAFLEAQSITSTLGLLMKCGRRDTHAFYPALNHDGLTLEEERFINLLFNRGRFCRIYEISFHPFNLLRLLTGIFPPQKPFVIDYTDLVCAGYYGEDDEPIEYGFNDIVSQTIQDSLILGDTIPAEEDGCLENKEILSANPVRSIISHFQKYILGFLNSKGGTIRFGVSDSGIVTGFILTREDKDHLRLGLGNALAQIVPSIIGADIQLIFRPVIHNGEAIVDTYCVDLQIPELGSTQVYRVRHQPHRTWVRLDGLTKEVSGEALQEYARLRGKTLPNP